MAFVDLFGVTNMNSEILKSKEVFNKFFRHDLYGVYDSEDNLILSRGGWNDENVLFPKLFEFCTNFTLKKHWTGYSDSLGHDKTLSSLLLLLNVNKKESLYELGNLSSTLGNVVTLGFVSKMLSDDLLDPVAITFAPYYSPIIKSIGKSFSSIEFVDSLSEEIEIIKAISSKIEKNKPTVLFLTNMIGIEGRTFSYNFWKEILKFVDDETYLVIDEGKWFEEISYPDEMNKKNVIRVVSLSKKYGIPGCKIGYMIADKDFTKRYYDYASTFYGGPLSIFFLLAEFIFYFEYIILMPQQRDLILGKLAISYGIPLTKLNYLFDDFEFTLKRNRAKFDKNYKYFLKWKKNISPYVFFTYDFGGINTFVKLKKGIKAYDFFLELIKKYRTSVIPSSCLGDQSDSMIRITLLENYEDFSTGLRNISKLLKTYASQK